jgi:hydroxyacylglutathione hydrolase
LKALPDDTLVYCGHEYTQSNTQFACALDPDNARLQQRAAQINKLRAESIPTVPSKLGEEKATNPFLRADSPELAAILNMIGAPPHEVFAEIRKRKDAA